MLNDTNGTVSNGDSILSAVNGADGDGELKPIAHNHLNGVDGGTIANGGGGGGDEDEYLEVVDQLSFKDEKHKDTLLSRLNTLRRNRELCDVVLLVDKRELYAHKAVLAAVSPTLFDMLSQLSSTGRDESPTTTGGRGLLTNGSSSKINDGQDGRNQQQQRDTTPCDNHCSPAFLEFNDVDYDCFDALVTYAYSGSLEICRKKAADLYKTASRFRMRSCALACAKYLFNQLNPQNCIGIRKCANRANDSLLASKVDLYIQENFAEIFQTSKEFLTLPSIQVEVILSVSGERPDGVKSMKEEQLAVKVLDWLQQHAQDLPEHAVFRMDMVTQRTHMLYLNDDLTLRDCCELDNSTVAGSSDIIRDYKKFSRRSSGQTSSIAKTKSRTNILTGSPGSKPLGRVSSTESMNSAASDTEEVEWKIIATLRVSESYCTALAVISRQLAALSIRVMDGSPVMMQGDYDRQPNPTLQKLDQNDGVPLAPMEIPRCAVGAVCLRGKLVVCGGYDRGECLNTVEEYDPSSNTWTMLSPLGKERGRFGATVVNDQVYAVGGSDGARDLNTVERYDPDSETWAKVTPMLNARSNHGVASTDGYVYVIGGCQWQRPLKHCERYDCLSDNWTTVAPLQQARYQAACCAVSDEIVAVGGFDTWTCTNSVECYNPETNTWRSLPPLGTARRGCGVAVLRDTLYVLGGSDGTQALCSVETLNLTDPQATWKPGPPLNTPRDNVRAVIVPDEQGDRLHAVGGFNGKTFLNSIEYLDEASHEWRTTFTTAPGVS